MKVEAESIDVESNDKMQSNEVNNQPKKGRGPSPWILALIALFAVPAIIVRIAMDDVPKRSEIKVITTFQSAVELVQGTFEKHASRGQGGGSFQGHLTPLPSTSTEWIIRLNPTGRRAPGGGPAVLIEADEMTGAIGLSGDDHQVLITVPAYRTLERHSITLYSQGSQSLNPQGQSSKSLSSQSTETNNP